MIKYSLIMIGFSIQTQEGVTIRFRFYNDAAPITCAAFAKQLPFTKTLMHARVSGQEVWTDDAPKLDIAQENASVFTTPGEVVIGPMKPERVKTSGAMGIYYGEGRGMDSCNIFAVVFDEDKTLLEAFGTSIWKQGEQTTLFSGLE
jgi:hypothetical protein